MRFNPPPGWPPPPPGWLPPPGWQPDPSWPAPPWGWQLYVEDERARPAGAGAWRVARRHPKTSLLLGAVLFLGTVGAVGNASEEPGEADPAAETATVVSATPAPRPSTPAQAAPPVAAPKPASPKPASPKPASTRSAPRPPVALPAGGDGRVERIVDGDTLVVRGLKVRLIGVDTPEVHSGVECFGQQASATTARLLPVGERVRLVYDVERLDRYGRTLAYVFRARDGLHVNLQLAREGVAQPMTIPPNVAHADAFLIAARQAREAGRGLWSACDGGTSTAAAPKKAAPAPPPPAPRRAVGQSAPAAAPAEARSGCDASYPDVCIPPAPPDLDCGQIEHRRFRVLSPDPHGFDGNKDGVGCESG